MAFDAWGAARDATDWTADVDDPTLVELGVGFTGHAAEPDAGLMNIGGRMYDAALGRINSVIRGDEKLLEVRLARDLADHFRRHYQTAIEMAQRNE